jgi:hypothetical protein
VFSQLDAAFSFQTGKNATSALACFGLLREERIGLSDLVFMPPGGIAPGLIESGELPIYACDEDVEVFTVELHNYPRFGLCVNHDRLTRSYASYRVSSVMSCRPFGDANGLQSDAAGRAGAALACP